MVPTPRGQKEMRQETRPYVDKTHHPLRVSFTLLTSFHPPSHSIPAHSSTASPTLEHFTNLPPPPPTSLQRRSQSGATKAFSPLLSCCRRSQASPGDASRVPSLISSRWAPRGAEGEACLPSPPLTLTPHRRVKALSTPGAQKETKLKGDVS